MILRNNRLENGGGLSVCPLFELWRIGECEWLQELL